MEGNFKTSITIINMLEVSDYEINFETYNLNNLYKKTKKKKKKKNLYKKFVRPNPKLYPIFQL